MQCAVTERTSAESHRWLCPRLPSPCSTDPAKRDRLQLALKSQFHILAALFSNSAPPHSTRTSVHVFAMSVLQQTFIIFTSRRSVPLQNSVGDRHSSHDYSAQLSLHSHPWYVRINAEIKENLDVNPMGLACLVHVSPLHVGASHNDSNGVVMTLSLRQYNREFTGINSTVTKILCIVDRTDRYLYHNTTPLSHKQTALCTTIPHRCHTKRPLSVPQYHTAVTQTDRSLYHNTTPLSH
jgi:hypothetical protein